MSETLKRIEELKQTALDEKAALDERITQTRQRIAELTQRGTRPFEEAWPEWLNSFNDLADRGRKRLENNLTEFARPHDMLPDAGHVRPPPHAHRPFEDDDAAAVLAYLNRDNIIDQAKLLLQAKCSDPSVPPREQRLIEVRELQSKLEALIQERDDVQDELAKLFRVDPSQRTKTAIRKAERSAPIDAMNENIARRNEWLND